MSSNDEPRVEMQSRAYNLRSSVRQLEHAGPSVGVVSRSPARDDRDILTITQSQ